MEAFKKFSFTDFEGKEEVGEGGQGTVFASTLKTENRKVALKIMNEHDLPKIISELKILQEMSTCQNSVEFLGYYEIDGTYTIVMELCKTTLQRIIDQREQGFEGGELKDLLLQIKNVAGVMNKLQIIHKDIKLDNFLVNIEEDRYIVKLSDYGASRLKDAEEQEDICTVTTASPEILIGKQYSEKSDIFSLGVVFYQLATKTLPFGDNYYSFCNLFKKEFDDQKTEVNLDNIKDKELSDLIRRMLKFNPENRINWNEFLNHSYFIVKKEIIYNITDISNQTKIFDNIFVDNNKENCSLLINNQEQELVSNYKFNNQGENKIVLLEKEPIINYSYMFCGVKSLPSSLECFKDWDVSKGEDFSFMFYSCKQITCLDGIKNWKFKKGKEFSWMFSNFDLLKSINDIENVRDINEEIFCNMREDIDLKEANKSKNKKDKKGKKNKCNIF